VRAFMNRCRQARQDDGFTLIELLVVVVIIGVLVAIAVPVYLNYRKGAADKSAQSDVRGAISAVEQFYTDNGNNLPDSASGTGGATASITLTSTSPAVPSPSTQTITLSDKTQLSYVNVPSGTSSYYRICATNSGGSGKWYVYNSSVGGSVSAAAAAVNPATCQ
jgi:type IV pilus assembly protein PilA